MPTQALKVAIAQLTSIDDTQKNLETVLQFTQQAVVNKSDVVIFPENSLFFRLASGSKVLTVGKGSSELNEISKLISGHRTHVLLTTPSAGEKDKARNSTWWLSPDGKIEEVYTKVHLFDVDVPGAAPVRESENFDHGLVPKVIEIYGWKIGLSICYDLRFAELYANYAQKVDLIVVPSAFLVPTGMAHWHVLLRARAIENQCFLAAPAQTGEHVSLTAGPDGKRATRQTFGHSLVVDPWGRVTLDMAGSSGMQMVEIKPEIMDQIRTQIPMASHRRLKST